MTTDKLAARHAAKAPEMDFPTLLSLLGLKDRTTLERQMLAYETKLGEAAAQRWRRLACMLRALAPGQAKLTGANGMQFFIPDGKYRKQVFAIQALPDGTIAVYAPNVLTEAVGARLLGTASEGNVCRLGKSAESLVIDPLDGKTPNPDALYKDMTGWNRKAVRINLPPSASEAQVRMVEQLCVLAAAEWAGKTE